MDNRQYYNVYFPSPSVSVGQRFFFFSSLKDTELGNAVSGILQSQLNQIKPDNDEGLKIIRGAMDFLAAMIENERANEIEYYTTNIVNNTDLPDDLRTQCQTLFSTQPLDYIEFINLINKYYDGVENYKQNLKYELQRLKKLKELYKTFHEHYTPDENGNYIINKKNKDTGNIEKTTGSFYSAFREFLLEGIKENNNWISRSDQQFGFNTKTMANTIQNQLKQIYNHLWNNIDFRSQIETAVYNTGLQGYEKQATLFVLQEFIHSSQGELASTFDGQEFKVKLNKQDIDSFIKHFINNLSIQPGETIEEKLENQLVNSLKNEAQGILTAEYKLNNSTDRILKSIKNKAEIKAHQNGGLENLSQEIIDLLQSVLKQQKKSTSVSNKKMWNNQDLYTALSEAFPEQELRIKSKKYDYGRMATVINNLLTDQTLVDIDIAAKDNIISEGLSKSGLMRSKAIVGRIKNIFMTFGTQKADVSGIELGRVKISQPNISWAGIAEKIVENYLETLKINNDIEIISKNLTFNEGEFRKKFQFGKSEFSIEAETMRRLAIKERELEQTEQELHDAGMSADEIKKVLSNFKDSVQIGSTVKSYNKYDNKQGFHGGSLGGTVETQLANIYTMFSYGGVTLPDIDWLTFAIYNAGPGLLGSGLREPIENILSTVAVMLMFDDAGQQAVYLNEQIKQRFNLSKNNGAKFLHLYYLNGSYYPSSFILQLTYNGLLQAYQQLDLEYMKGTEAFDSFSNGSHAYIINPVSESNEIGTRVSNDVVTTKQSQWASTFSANQKSVKIQVTFLAGMLDIISILNQNMK